MMIIVEIYQILFHILMLYFLTKKLIQNILIN